MTTQEQIPSEIPVCQLDADGYFVSVTVADLSREDGTYLIPGGCVNTEPPSIPAGKRARYVAGGWVLEDAANPPDGNPLPQDPKEQILCQIDAIERQTLMNRAVREFMLAQAEQIGEAAGYTPAQLYQVNVGYRKVKDVDTEIVALRAKL